MEAVAPEMPVRSKGAKATVVDDEGGVQKWGNEDQGENLALSLLQ